MLEAATYRAILAFCNPKSSDSLHNTPNYPKTLQRNIKKEALEKKTVIKKLLKDFFASPLFYFYRVWLQSNFEPTRTQKHCQICKVTQYHIWLTKHLTIFFTPS